MRSHTDSVTLGTSKTHRLFPPRKSLDLCHPESRVSVVEVESELKDIDSSFLIVKSNFRYIVSVVGVLSIENRP